MSRIDSLGNGSPIQSILSHPVRRQVSPTTTASGSTPTDQLELSSTSQFMAALKSNGIRADKVAAVKSQIEAGTYEDDNKLDVATGRLLDDLSD